MNFLAHLYLSGNNPEIKIGNFIGDFVKGNRYNDYADNIKTGILLHRKIDSFTDTHPCVKQSTQRVKEKYQRYSGVVTDLFYDHFLAVNWMDYSNQPLSEYVSEVNTLLIRNYFKLPGEVKRFLPFLVKSRRLETYQTAEGIRRSLTIMTNHSSLPDHVDYAMAQLEKHYEDFDRDFKTFFAEVKTMTDVALIKGISDASQL